VAAYRRFLKYMKNEYITHFEQKFTTGFDMLEKYVIYSFQRKNY
jgi:hypothetical protein